MLMSTLDVPLRRIQATSHVLEASWMHGVLAAYVGLVGVMLFFHEPWRDEAQAWLLARDASLWSLLTEYLRYEGSPGLWHLILILPAKAGMPYVTLNVITAAAGIFAAYLILYHSPFPPVLKAILPFTYYLFYQYVVVARSYALIAPLLFLLALVWPKKTTRVYLFTFLLVLLANTSPHGALIAGSLMALHVLDVVRSRAQLGRQILRRQFVAVGAFGVVTALLALQLLPPSDRTDSFPAPGLSSLRTVATIANGATTGFEPVSILVFLALIWWFWRSRTLSLFIVPASAVAALSVFGYHRAYHVGISALLALFVLWVSLARIPRGTAVDLRARRLALAALVVVCAVQTFWSAGSFRYDLRHPYSGSEALAAFLGAHGDGKTIYAASFPSEDSDVHGSVGAAPASAVQPYFDRNIYANYNHGRPQSFWKWSTGIDLIYEPRRILNAQPDLIVLSVVWRGSERQPRLYPGYRVLARFPGKLAWKNGTLERESYILLERTTPS